MLSEIVSQGLCTGCGICISEDTSKTSFMQRNTQGFLVPNVGQTKTDEQQKMMRVCPFNPNEQQAQTDEDSLGQELFGQSRHNPQIGYYDHLFVGYAKEHRVTSSSGGLATYIFKHLLEHKIVDALFVVNEQQGAYSYGFVDSAQQISSISKTRYIPVTMEELFVKIDQVPGKIAVCGVGCFLKAVRLKQHYHPQYKQKISLCIGIICGGLKSEFFTDYLSQSAGIHSGYYKQEYRIKNAQSQASDYSFGAYDKQSNEFKTVQMRTLGDMWGTGLFKSNACDFCDDVTTELADISLGDAWLSPYNKQGLGNSIVIARTPAATQLLRRGIANKELVFEDLSIEQVISSQKGSFTHRQDALAYRLKLTQQKGLLVPRKRKRFFKEIDFSSKRVQQRRMAIRQASLDLWQKYPDIVLFENYIKQHRRKLKKATKFNHTYRKINFIEKLFK